MKKKRFRPILLATIILALMLLACRAVLPTVSPSATQVSILSTNTISPTSNPATSPVPSVAGTNESDQIIIQKYFDKGYLSSTNGQLINLTPATFEMAQINYLYYVKTGAIDAVKDFAFWADMKWSSAGPVNYPEYSGCGIAFRIGSNKIDSYNAMLTSDSLLVTWCLAALGNRCGRIATTKGTGMVKFGNPAEAHFEFIAHNGHAYALVNGDFLAEFTFLQGQLIKPGNFAYSIISGTNKDYGTRCSMTNSKLWIPNP